MAPRALAALAEQEPSTSDPFLLVALAALAADTAWQAAQEQRRLTSTRLKLALAALVALQETTSKGMRS